MASLSRKMHAVTRTSRRLLSTGLDPTTPVIVSAARTPIGSFQGKLAPLSGPQLMSLATKEVLQRTGLDPALVDEAIVGNVVSAGAGQAPTRQAIIGAGIPYGCPATTINKVCSSGMKSIMFASQAVRLGSNCVLAGGFESMSNVPYYMPKARTGYGLGHQQVQDGIIKDGLWDVYTDQHMGNCAEKCAKDYSFSREDQDAYAIQSYKRATEASEAGHFKGEIVPVDITNKKGTQTIAEDEEFRRFFPDKMPKLRAAFQKDGTVTPANASTLNDGACAVLVCSAQFAKDNNLTPLAAVRGFADAAQAPEDFTTAPSLAIPRALKAAGVDASDVDFYEINEAFSVVALANNKILGLDADRVNVWGGAVALGHPVGMSGARIVTTLLSVLKHNNSSIGVAGICNGGGGASSIVIERLN